MERGSRKGRREGMMGRGKEGKDIKEGNEEELEASDEEWRERRDGWRKR